MKTGRTKVYADAQPFDIKNLSADLKKKFEEGQVRYKERTGQEMTRRGYLEHLLRTHPELQKD